MMHGMDSIGHIISQKRVCEAVLRQAYLVVANSNALAEELFLQFGLSNVIVVYPSVDPSDYTKPEIRFFSFSIINRQSTCGS